MNASTIKNNTIFASILIISTLCLGWEDWPVFQGPSGNCSSSEKGLLKKWPETGLKTLWTVKLNPGYGGPLTHDGKVYILDRIVNEDDRLRCLDLKTGVEEWIFSYNAPGKISYPGSRSHPAVDDKYVFIMGPFGDFYCISKKSHKPVWKKNILKDFDGAKPNWAVAQSPAFYKDTVIVAPVGKKAGAVAYKKNSGKIAWKSKPLKGKMTYASPVVTKIGKVDQVMILTTDEIVGVNVKSGKVLWSFNGWTCRIPIASPTHIGGGKVFATGGYGAGACMFQVQKKGGKFTTKKLFKTKECNCQIQQPILYKDHLYLNGNDKGKRDGFICMDLKGNLKWRTGKSPNFDWGGIILADDMIYTIDGPAGDLCLVKPDPKGYREISRVHLLQGDKIWSHMALSDGKLLLRDQTQLKCVDVRGDIK